MEADGAEADARLDVQVVDESIERRHELYEIGRGFGVNLVDIDEDGGRGEAGGDDGE